MKHFAGCNNYTLIEKEKLTDVKTTAYTLRHNKTNARVVLLENDDENKAFIIGFKTPQKDSTGVPHILEHAVLCGSEKYPVKDAMTEVSKGSLNTFLNAFTYPDRTLYPVASCNDKDFKNLMSVYLDAVFHPMVHKEKKIFMQEGWHYELNKKKDDLKINGVVYNEMKGVYSSPESALSSYIMFSLFPDTQYGVESGGDPDVIPTLTYEDFCDFHKKLYHPSNSRIFLYGKMDFEEALTFIDEEYLSKYEAINPDSEVKLQKPFKKRIRVEKEYSISDAEDDKNATFLSYNVVCSDYTDLKTTEVMDIINYALCTVPGAKLKERLIDAGIGKDVYSELTTDTCQKVFSIIAEGANAEDEERFVTIIEDTLIEIIENGFDRKTLKASITSNEFSYREADFGYYPKGIAFGTMTFEEWLYSDENIFSGLKQNRVYKELREGIKTGLFETVLKERVLENEHKSIVVMKPVRGLSEKKENELSKKLADYKDSLSKEEIDELLASTKAFEKYHNTPDTEEAIATIPTLSIGDIRKEIEKIEYDVFNVEGINEVFTNIDSNGIAYFTLAFSAKRLPARLLPALSILKTLIGYVDTKSYTYGELVNEINIVSGGINALTSLYKDRKNVDDYSFAFEIRAKAFYNELHKVFALINEMLFTSKFEDKKRVKENLEQSKIRLQGYMLSSGHAVSISRAAASVNESSALNEMVSGMGQFRFIEKLLKDFDKSFESLLADFKEIVSILFTKDNLEVNLGCEDFAKEQFDAELTEFIGGLNKESISKEKLVVEKAVGNEAFSCASQVQYVATYGNFKKSSKLPYTGSLEVLRTILNTDYLWNTVRLQGGAYGCMCSFSTNGDGLMVSYRDPNLKKTVDAYNKCADYVRNYNADEETVERYIISTLGDLDAPITSSMKAMRSYSVYKSHTKDADRQKTRDEILSTTPAKVRALAKYVESISSSEVYSAVGGEEKLKKEGKMFDTVSPLFLG